MGKKTSKDLDAFEDAIENDIALGNFKPVKSDVDYQLIAKSTKEARINLRINNDILDHLKQRAEKEGIPYQTLINQILFKFSVGQLQDRKNPDLEEKVDFIYQKIKSE